jgi:hypothetical protein
VGSSGGQQSDRNTGALSLWIGLTGVFGAGCCTASVLAADGNPIAIASAIVFGVLTVAFGYVAVASYFLKWPFMPSVTTRPAPVSTSQSAEVWDPNTPSFTLLPDEPERQRLRDQLGLRAITPLEAGLLVPQVPGGAFFFMSSGGLNMPGFDLGVATVGAKANGLHDQVEVHKTTGVIRTGDSFTDGGAPSWNASLPRVRITNSSESDR